MNNQYKQYLLQFKIILSIVIISICFVSFSRISVRRRTRPMSSLRQSKNEKKVILPRNKKTEQATLEQKVEPKSEVSAPVSIQAPVGKKEVQKNNFDIPIRVLLAENSMNTKQNLQLQSGKGFSVIYPDKQTKILSDVLLRITTDKKQIIINGKKTGQKSIFLKPLEQPVLFNNNAYAGCFAVTLDNGMVYVINHIPLEEYVECVLHVESWPGWSLAFNKLFCIVVRTYGVAKLLEERQIRKKRGLSMPYDIRNTNTHQTYKGSLRTGNFKQAVDETRGLIIAYNNKPILAMFDGCCGGVIPGHIKGIDFHKAPYLARNHPCHYCKDHKFYTWKLSFPLRDVEAVLKKEYKKLNRLRDIEITGKDPAGLVTDVTLKGRSSIMLTGRKFKALLKNNKSHTMVSLCFSLEKCGSTITAHGKGHGHHMGLCQWGA